MNSFRSARLLCCLVLLLAGSASTLAGAPSADPAAESRGHIKRIALRVPDIDLGIRFFRDVIGFQLDLQFTMEPGADPYFPLVFNFKHEKPVRMALFSTAREPRGLFLAEAHDMRVPASNEAVNHATVLEVPDLAALRERAEKAGFATEEPQQGKAPDGTGFSEMLVHGPGGHRVLVFQYSKP